MKIGIIGGTGGMGKGFALRWCNKPVSYTHLRAHET